MKGGGSAILPHRYPAAATASPFPPRAHARVVSSQVHSWARCEHSSVPWTGDLARFRPVPGQRGYDSSLEVEPRRAGSCWTRDTVITAEEYIGAGQAPRRGRDATAGRPVPRL